MPTVTTILTGCARQDCRNIAEILIGGDLTALYRQDLLVFFGPEEYEYVFEDDNLQSGEAFTLGIGTSLAVSPETSLSLFLHSATGTT